MSGHVADECINFPIDRAHATDHHVQLLVAQIVVSGLMGIEQIDHFTTAEAIAALPSRAHEQINE